MGHDLEEPLLRTSSPSIRIEHHRYKRRRRLLMLIGLQILAISMLLTWVVFHTDLFKSLVHSVSRLSQQRASILAQLEREGESISFGHGPHRFRTDQRPGWHAGAYHLADRSLADSERFFVRSGSSNCFKPGTDLYISALRKNQDSCSCRPHYHGADCAIPDSVYQAINTLMEQNVNDDQITRLVIKRTENGPRRLIAMANIADCTSQAAELAQWLRNNSDLIDFALVNLNNSTECNFNHTSNKQQQHQQLQSNSTLTNAIRFDELVESDRKSNSTISNRILRLKPGNLTDPTQHIAWAHLWLSMLYKVTDYQPNDLIFMLSATDLPSHDTISFLSLYEGFSDPVIIERRNRSDSSSATFDHRSNYAISFEFISAICNFDFGKWANGLCLNQSSKQQLAAIERFKRNFWPISVWTIYE